jgi:trans-aconitate 2-methyltransferase
MRVVDLGCGTGKLTRLLHEQLNAKETKGVDSSDNMLASAQSCGCDGLRFVKGHIEEFAADSAFDLVFSNAALQWVPDHEALFARLTSVLGAEGQLAVQMPAMQDDAAHALAAEIAARVPFRAELDGFEEGQTVHAPEWYAQLLYRLGYRQQHVRIQVYPHVLPARDAVVEWYRGSLLTAYQARLADPTFEHFVRVFRRELMLRLSDDRPYFFPFRRVLMWGQR